MPKKNEQTNDMHYKFKCPKCGKRLFDSLTLPHEKVVVSFKCRQCNESVEVEMTRKNLMVG